jgi:hypothetical protein
LGAQTGTKAATTAGEGFMAQPAADYRVPRYDVSCKDDLAVRPRQFGKELILTGLIELEFVPGQNRGVKASKTELDPG